MLVNSGIDLSPYQEDIFFLSKPYKYEYGNIKILQHMKINRPFIEMEKERIRKEEEAAAIDEAERIAREKEEEEARKNKNAFGKLASGAFKSVSSMWGRKGTQDDQNDESLDDCDYQDHDDEGNRLDSGRLDEVEEENQVVVDYDNVDNVQHPVDDGGEEEEKVSDKKFAKKLKFWGK